MQKSKMVLVLLAFVMAAMGITPGPLHCAPQTIKIAMGSPKGSLEDYMAIAFKGVIENLRPDDIKVEIYPGEVLGTLQEMLDGLKAGTTQMVIDEVPIYARFYAPVKFFNTPYAFDNPDQVSKLMKTAFWKEFTDVMASKTGIRLLALHGRAPRTITTTAKVIRTPEDMKGMKIRVSSVKEVNEVYKALGCNPTPIAYSELYLALKMGVVEGQENPPANIANMKFYEVQKYFINTGPIFSINSIAMSESFLQSLRPEVREDVLVAGQIAAEYGAALDRGMDAASRRFLLTKGGMTLIDVDQQRFKDATRDVYKQFLGGEFTEEIYQKMKKAVSE